MLDEKDIRVDTNSINEHVRLVHMPTGETSECSAYPIRNWNKCFAMGVLTERLSNKHLETVQHHCTRCNKTMSVEFEHGQQVKIVDCGCHTQNTENGA